MKKIFITLFAAVLIQSCIFTRIDDSIDLGNNYRYIQDAPQTIIYHKTPKYEGSGINIVPPMVLAYKFDENFIIVKSQEVDEMTGSKEGKPIHYWIIDKSTKGASITPMDSATFYQRLDELNIKLTL